MMIILIIMIHKLLIMLDLWVGKIDLNNAKHLKNEESLPVVCHPTRVLYWCMLEDEKAASFHSLNLTIKLNHCTPC